MGYSAHFALSGVILAGDHSESVTFMTHNHPGSQLRCDNHGNLLICRYYNPTLKIAVLFIHDG
jgi:hypothetical protein